MVKKKNISVREIQKLSYPDFIGFINQWNTPPGAYTTISKLATFSAMNSRSRILEVACSTGFSSREFAALTSCNGIGFDRSAKSISMANLNKTKYLPKAQISYAVADGYKFKNPKLFSHIMVGGGLKFFPDPASMLERCIGMLRDGGYILATPYYQVRPIPKGLVQRTHKGLGIPLAAFANFSYKQVMALFNKLEVVYEDRNGLLPETKEEIQYYCTSVIDRAYSMHQMDDHRLYQAMFRRLFDIRALINASRPYQEYAVLVLRYRKSVYPRRYVPLFQYPR